MMEVQWKCSKVAKYGELCEGDAFEHDSVLFIKSLNHATDLCTGGHVTFSEGVYVIPHPNAKVVVE